MWYVLQSFCLLKKNWCPCMAIKCVQYNGGLLPDILLLTQCYYHRGTLLNATKRFCFEEWPKSGIPDGYVAIIGYPSNSTTETAPGRHLIGQRRPLPDRGHIFTGCTRFWLFDSRRVPDSHAPYPIMATNTRVLRPTAHRRAIPGSCSPLSTAMAFFQIDALFKAHACLSPSLSLSNKHNNQT